MPLLYDDVRYLYIYMGIALIMSVMRQISIFTVFFGLGIFLYFLSYYSTGSYFLGGGDDELFYDVSIQYANGSSLTDIEVLKNSFLISTPYVGFIVLQGLFFKVFLLLGLAPTPFWILIFKSFTSAFSFGVLMRIYCNTSSIDYFFVRNRLIWFPGIVISSVFGLRESIGFLVLMMIVVLLGRLNWLRFILVCALLVVLFFIRRLAVLLVLWLLICALFRRLTSRPYTLRIVFLSISALLIFVFSDVDVGDRYMEMSMSQARDGSLGFMLYSNQVLFPIQMLYTFLSPIPPVYSKNPNLFNFVALIGDTVRYFYYGLLLILVLFEWREMTKKVSFQWLMQGLFLIVLIVNLTSRDPRHFDFMMPLIFLLSISSVHLLKKRYLTNYIGVFMIAVPSIIILFALV